MQSVRVDMVFWKQEKGEGQSLKIQSVLFTCDIPVFTQNLPFHKIFKSDLTVNGCGKCDHPLRVPSSKLLERLAILTPVSFGGCVGSQTHRAIKGITKHDPTNALIEAPAHPHPGGAVTQETY